jgi:hypothetical protein
VRKGDNVKVRIYALAALADAALAPHVLAGAVYLHEERDAVNARSLARARIRRGGVCISNGNCYRGLLLRRIMRAGAG